MNREELLKIAKPILFNVEMVQAILEGRKTVTRRAVKLKYNNTHLEMRDGRYGAYLIEIENFVEGVHTVKNPDGSTTRKLIAKIDRKPPYRSGDILYVRETWSEWTGGYVYKAWTSPFGQPGRYSDSVMKWHPSIHMPKEAARIFLRIKDVRAERLQDITCDEIIKEGLEITGDTISDDAIRFVKAVFATKVWNDTIKKSDLDLYGWDANPWVWVIEFERIDVNEHD